jgi:hypothetical protein
VTLVWYAAYGSNTDDARFTRYLDGCAERTTPLDSRPYVLDLPLYFAGSGSRRWGPGGVAFVDVVRDLEPRTLGRAWLLPAEIVAQIGAQENGLPVDAAALDLDLLDHDAFPGRWYDRWVRCGELDGVPVITLTSSTRREPAADPGPAYVSVVAAGIRATHGVDAAAVASYLAARTNLSFTTLMEWQRGGPG